MGALRSAESIPGIDSNPRSKRIIMTMTDRAASRRAVAASTIGSVLEYYDFFVYGTMSALVLGQLFFPTDNPGVSTLLALVTFTVGFIARPIGGIILGHFGDRLGRRRVLLFTFILTGVVTVLIGALPTYAQVGIAAPILLLVLRILQGVAIGGEWGGAALLAVESAPGSRRGLFGAFIQGGAPVGIILSAGSVALLTGILPMDQVLAWGWRLPFLASIILLVVGIVLRLSVEESPVFEKIKRSGTTEKVPVLVALRRYPKEIVAAILIHTSDTTLGFIQGVFVLGYASGVLHIPAPIVLLANITSAVVNLAVNMLMGVVADRIGQRRVLYGGLIGMVVWAFPMFWLIGSGQIWALFLAVGVGGALVGATFSTQATLFADFFEPRVRYTGMSLGFQIGTVVGGGFGPLIANALTGAVGGTWIVSVYLVFIALVAIVATAIAKPKFGATSDLALLQQKTESIAR
jgi:MFS transporter, MHS family, shikimate and dehydroshikimate transport protein